MNFITTITSTQEIWRDSTQVFHTISGTNTVPLLEVRLGTWAKFNQTPRFDIGDPVKSKNQNKKIEISKKLKLNQMTQNSLHLIVCMYIVNSSISCADGA